METKAVRSDQVSQREKENKELAYQIACEGIVLLENDGALPIRPGKIALFGAGSTYTIFGGSGSGEVKTRHNVNVLEGLKEAGFSISTEDWIERYDALWKKGKEKFIKDNQKKLLQFSARILADLLAAEYLYPSGDRISEEEIRDSKTDTCIYVVSRQSGEGHDRKDEKGNFRLDDIEIENIRLCASMYECFILVLNTGCIIDLSDLDQIKGINAIVYMGQAGMESGRALTAVLTGKETPSGKLALSWPMRYTDIPFHEDFGPYNKGPHVLYKEGIYVGYRYFETFDRSVRYPFGYGLSYTDFAIDEEKVTLDKTDIKVHLRVKNTGDRFGRQVVQVYASIPGGEAKRLVAFSKTGKLEAGEEEKMVLSFPISELSIYEEEKSETLIPSGEYILYVGTDVKSSKPLCILENRKQITLSKHQALCKPDKKICELKAPERETMADLERIDISDMRFETVQYDYSKRKEVFDEEVNGFLDRFKTEELAKYACGTGLFGENKGFKVPGAVGHSCTDHIDAGIPNVEFCDGPAGLRLQRRSAIDKKGKIKAIDASISLYEFLPRFLTKLLLADESSKDIVYQFVTGFPVAATIAQTWNAELVCKMGDAVGREMEEYGVTYWLAPALNIVRNPLCGRNYEYYSEDPFLSGKLAAAVCKGVQSHEGRRVTIKHFAVNNQETDRYTMSSDLDEKTLRQIYLKGFSIAVKEGRPKAVMSAYNKINGVYCANNKQLCTDILRKEWGFEGIVMTDWLSTGKDRADEAKCILSGVDLIMPGGKKVVQTIVEDVKNEKLDRTALQTSAGRFLSQILNQ